MLLFFSVRLFATETERYSGTFYSPEKVLKVRQLICSRLKGYTVNSSVMIFQVHRLFDALITLRFPLSRNNNKSESQTNVRSKFPPGFILYNKPFIVIMNYSSAN